MRLTLAAPNGQRNIFRSQAGSLQLFRVPLHCLARPATLSNSEVGPVLVTPPTGTGSARISPTDQGISRGATGDISM